MVIQVPEEAFELGILKKDFHARLLADLKRFAAQAGIPPEYVWSRLSQYCTGADLTWVRKMREGKDHGLIYVGTNFAQPIEDKMMAIAGACLRNYIDARVMTVQDVLNRLKNDTMPAPTLVLVPNFCMSKDDAQGVAPWEAGALLGWLYSRLARNLKTVLYVGSMEALQIAYGDSMHKHLLAHYSRIEK